MSREIARRAQGFWQAAGDNITNLNTGFVGIKRSTPVTGAEYFGIQAPVTSGYGGMYIRTDGTSALPFYGYRAGPAGESAWSYLDGASGDWRLNVDGDLVAAHIARELHADTLIILSNVPGLLREVNDPQSLIPQFELHEIEHYETYAAGRMKKKLLAAQQANAACVILADSRVVRPIDAALAGGGTHILQAVGDWQLAIG